MLGGNLAHQLPAATKTAVRVRYSAGNRNHSVIRVLGVGLFPCQVNRLAQHYDGALQLAFVLIEIRRFLDVEDDDIAGDLAVGRLAPTEGANADGPLDGAGDLCSLRPRVQACAISAVSRC